MTTPARPDWKSWKDSWRRFTQVVPAYDHRSAGGGVHGADWIYVVSDGECALVLCVFSNRRDGAAPGERRPAEGAYLRLHVPWPMSLDHVRRDWPGEECAYTETGRCFAASGSCLAADDLFKAHGVDDLEQQETFWNALRAKAEEWIADARATRGRLAGVRRCAFCGGRGVTGAEGIKEED